MPVKAKKTKKLSAKKPVNNASIQVKQLLNAYENHCTATKTTVDNHLKEQLKTSIAAEKYPVNFVLHGEVLDDSLPVVSIVPLVKGLRSCTYKNIKELYLWKLTIPYEDVVLLSAYLEQPSYNIEYLELLECNIDAYTLKRFAQCFQTNKSVKSLVFDHTVLREEGLSSLCTGLKESTSLVKLSLCYCMLGMNSGRILGKLIANTSISELYIDGNSFECHGLIDLIQVVADHAEYEAIQRNEKPSPIATAINTTIMDDETKLVMGLSQLEPALSLPSQNSSETTADKMLNEKSVKKKKKKGKRGKSATIIPPKVGPWLSILHIANNSIDQLSQQSDLTPYEAVKVLNHWIVNSTDLVEINIEDNLIGELGAREILDALEERKKAGLKDIYVKVSHQINSSLFQKIVTIASGEKKSKKGKKKKKAAGKRRV